MKVEESTLKVVRRKESNLSDIYKNIDFQVLSVYIVIWELLIEAERMSVTPQVVCDILCVCACVCFFGEKGA